MPNHCILTRHESVFRLKHVNYKMSVHASATAASAGDGAAVNDFVRSFKQNHLVFSFNLTTSAAPFSVFFIFVLRFCYDISSNLYGG